MKQPILVIKYKDGQPVIIQALAATETELNRMHEIILKEAANA